MEYFFQLCFSAEYFTLSLIDLHHFATVPNSKKLQTTTEMWLLKRFQNKDYIENIVENGEIAYFEQSHLSTMFPNSFFLHRVKISINGGNG